MTKKEIEDLMHTSLKEGKKYEVGVYRLVKAEFLKAEKEHGVEPDEEKCNSIIFKMIEQRKDSIEQYQKGNRQDLADVEAKEIDVLKTLVPEVPSEEDIIRIVNISVNLFKSAHFGCVSMKDTKQIMEATKIMLPNAPNLGKYVSKAIRENQ